MRQPRRSGRGHSAGAPDDRGGTRRDLLEWMGKGSVLALSSLVLKGCGEPGDIERAFPWMNPGEPGEPAVGFEFRPGPTDHGIFEGWGERTVDRQMVQQLLESWELMVGGMVERPTTFSFADLLTVERQDTLVDFHCVEGWSIYDVPWNGIHLRRLLDAVGVDRRATHVTFHTVGDGYNESLPLHVAVEPRTLLAYGIAGNTLPLKHGFPLRLVVPRLYAYKSAKYVSGIELTDHPVEGYWVAAGYPYMGEVPEGRLRPNKY